MGGRRNNLRADFYRTDLCDFQRVLARRQNPAMAWLGPLRQLDLDHLHRLHLRLLGKTLRTERAIFRTTAEIAGTHLPDEVAPWIKV